MCGKLGILGPKPLVHFFLYELASNVLEGSAMWTTSSLYSRFFWGYLLFSTASAYVLILFR